MTHAFVPQHLIEFAEYIQKIEFSDEQYDLQCVHGTIINRAFLSTYLHAQEWIITNGPIKDDIRKYASNDVGYHFAIIIALEKLNKNKISRLYSEFIKLRVNADYNIVTIINSKDAQRALNLANRIQNALQ